MKVSLAALFNFELMKPHSTTFLGQMKQPSQAVVQKIFVK